MPIRVGLLLLPLFPMYVVVLAMDGLRLANKYAGQRVFDWRLLSHCAQSVEASNGIKFDCDNALLYRSDVHYAFVVAGDDQSRSLTPQLRDWLVKMAGAGTTLGAIDSGTFALAESRLIRGREVTVHPQAMPAFREQFPGVGVNQRNVVNDRSLITCAGGISTVQLVLALAEEHCGPAVARYVANDMVVAAPDDRPVRPPRSDRRDDKIGLELEDVLDLMNLNVETPLSLPELSKLSRLSERQISRIFLRRFGQSPMSYYRKLRLTYAKQLLFQSGLSISEIAIASGFQSTSAFSRCFASEFHRSPRELLKGLRETSNAPTVPEHHLSRRLKLRET